MINREKLKKLHQREEKRFLAEHPGVAKVNYPGLETHPRHARARQLFDLFGGMLSFELKGGLEARRTRSLAELDVIYVYLDGFGEGGDELLTSFGFPGFNGGRCARRTRLRGSTKNFAGASRRKGRCRVRPPRSSYSSASWRVGK